MRAYHGASVEIFLGTAAGAGGALSSSLRCPSWSNDRMVGPLSTQPPATGYRAGAPWNMDLSSTATLLPTGLHVPMSTTCASQRCGVCSVALSTWNSRLPLRTIAKRVPSSEGTMPSKRSTLPTAGAGMRAISARVPRSRMRTTSSVGTAR